MTKELIVRTGPQEYECREGVLSTLPKRLEERFVKNILIVHGAVSWQKARPYLEALYKTDFSISELAFSGECSYEEVDRIVRLASQNDCDAIIGVGGGKIMDAVKYAAAKAGCILSVMIPTLASNCAPWTPLSVMYTEEGVFIRYDFL
ncbi:iron-containing alcohol dehydrogenase, partial [uncultured Trichococcus sp.]